MQKFSRMMLRPTPLHQPTGPLQLRPRALRVATHWSLGLLDLDTLELRRPLARLPSKILIRFARASRWTGFWRWPRCRRSTGRFCAPLRHYSTSQDHSSFGPARCVNRPFGARPAGLGHSRARTAASPSEPTEQDYSSGLAGPRDGQPFENIFSGWNAGGLLDDVDPPSAAASTSGQSLRSAAYTAIEAAPALPSAAARVSPLRAPPVSFSPFQPRAPVLESENSACDFFPAPRLVDGILISVWSLVFLLLSV